MKKILAAILCLLCLTAAVLPLEAKKKPKPPMPQEEFLNICARGKLSQVGKGVKRGADLNASDKKGLTPLICAAREQDDPDVIVYLIKKGAQVNRPNDQGLTPVMAAAMYNPTVRVMKALLQYGADPRKGDITGSSALIGAARLNRNPAVLETLLKDAPELVNVPSRSGLTPLMATASNRGGAMTALLLDHGADDEAKDRAGRTALSHAAEKGNTEALRVLLTRGDAVVNLADRQGMTPLMYAAASGSDPRALELLLDHGAKTGRKDTKGRGALWHAKRNKALAGAAVLERLR